MRMLLITMLLGFVSFAAPAREPVDLAEVYSAAENEMEAFREQGRDEEALAALKSAHDAFRAADPSVRKKGGNARRFEILTYDLACAYARSGRTDSALVHLEDYYGQAYGTYSTAYRRQDFYHIARDPDLDPIRGDDRFRELLARFEEAGWERILEQHGNYAAIESKLPSFIYVDADWEGLPELREKYGLEAIAGPGDDVSRILNLLHWVHATIRHDGNAGEPTDRHAAALIELCREQDRGLNCWMLATVLNEVYLAMDYRSRIVSCYPMGDPSITHEWHVITEVYVPSLAKWIWVDPTLDTGVRDDEGDLLGIAEVRRRLVDGLPVHASPGMNWNGPTTGGAIVTCTTT